MAYSHNLIRKGIKRNDPRMCKKGAESAAVAGHDFTKTKADAIESLRVQG